MSTNSSLQFGCCVWEEVDDEESFSVFYFYARKVSMSVRHASTAIWVFPKASFKIKFGVLKIESYLNKMAKQQQQKQQCHRSRRYQCQCRRSRHPLSDFVRDHFYPNFLWKLHKMLSLYVGIINMNRNIELTCYIKEIYFA